MSYKFEEGKDKIIDAVVKKIKSDLDENCVADCEEFVKQLFSTVAVEDLSDWDIEDLYGAVLSFWSQIEKRLPHQTKIRIYNPDFERHSWQSTHTVVEIITDDMPFLVDSIGTVVRRMGFFSHLIMHKGGLFIERDEEGNLLKLYQPDEKPIASAAQEAVIFILMDRQTDPEVLDELHQKFERVLEDNHAVYEDWPFMREKVREAIAELEDAKTHADKEEIEETRAFLTWIEDHHFTFLGVRDYELIDKNGEKILKSKPETGLGVLRKELSKSKVRNISTMTPEARELTLSSRILVMSKTNTLASVHRDNYTDYIGIKRFDKKGNVIGERRIIGLYTSAAYNTSPKHIPFLRRKVALVMEKSKLKANSHAGKVLLNILETLPRDDLIQASEEDLLEIGMGIFYMQERRQIRMFAREDIYRRFVSCLVYVPRELYNTELRQVMQDVLATRFNATEISFATHFSESILARIHFIIRLKKGDTQTYDFKAIEKQLIEVARSWADDLQHYLLETFGEEESNSFFQKYRDTFSIAYRDHFTARTAVSDIKYLETLSRENPLAINFYRPVHEASGNYRLKLYRHESTIALSDVLPILESLGLHVISERPYMLKYKDGSISWVNDFSMHYAQEDNFSLEQLKELFQDAFANIWAGHAENDKFNLLVLAAGLDWRQVSVLRTYAKYFKQIGLPFSQHYIEKALYNNLKISSKLIELFEIQFNPEFQNEKRDHDFNLLVSELLTDLDSVSNLDEDKIIRQYIQTISSTLRTNFYQTDPNGKPKPYLSMKLNSKTIPLMPKPYPLYEIFVYSPFFEGVHLRGGKVARGGLRWSDRREDFRTEVLGLMKAQQVKNAVIVPSGAKGGFVPTQMPDNGSREEIFAEGVRCYQHFIRALLDITDNLVDNKIVKPEAVICHDEDDPYLVVAADKGTATFSDLANSIAIEYGFWLGDAFASGGSIGYDHKKMGITAKGAWESVKRNFYEMGIDINNTDFTVVGIGDMSGDVFGNGMLLSKHIKLQAAFNHLHIFIDPTPDPASSFKERARLFDLPRSSWADYDTKLISKGGGVFSRAAKSIKISEEIKKLLNIKESSLEPNELIRYVLKAKVDLLWSGGIGTYVKSRQESNADVGDRANDFTRVNADDLRCKSIGEGGNLGVTQKGRMEFALKGGLVYTDFIDNSAGVNCSDKEVNIKILLNSVVSSGDLTFKQRNELLAEMTEDVSKLVLKDNYLQARAISLIHAQSSNALELHSRYINELERVGKIDRALEYLPEDKVLMERKLVGKGLSRPAIAVLLCYSKTILKEDILNSDVPEDDFMKHFLINSFPKALQEKFREPMQAHPLRREIIATKISNIIVNEMGFSFVYRLQDETGAPVPAIVRAYMITRTLLNLDEIWHQLDILGTSIPADKQIAVMRMYVRLSRRVTRWFLRTRTSLKISEMVQLYAPGFKVLKESVPQNHTDSKGLIELYDKHVAEHVADGITKALAHEIVMTNSLFSAPDIITIANERAIDVIKVAEIYFSVGEFLSLSWVRKQIIIHPTENHWESLSREALRDDLDWQQRQIVAGIIDQNTDNENYVMSFEHWSIKHRKLIDRWNIVLAELNASSSLNYTMFFVAIRELADLTQTTIRSQCIS